MHKKVHFIGICGTGMSAVAKLYLEMGWTVSGSDDAFYPPVSTYIESIGLKPSVGYRAENIPNDADLVIIGKNAKLVPESNAEVKRAFDDGYTIKSFPEVLYEITKGRENIVVAGSYGKSTSTALMSWVLQTAGKDPGYFAPVVANNFKDTAKLGTGKQFVLEGDEYPSANWDNRSKFLYYRPHDLLLIAAKHDHVNVFPTLFDYHKPFKELLAQIPIDGICVVCADEPLAIELVKDSNINYITYAIDNEAIYTIKDITYGKNTHFKVYKNNEPVVALSTKLLGRHNLQNILGVSAMLLEKNLVTHEQLYEAVSTFRGVKRRTEVKEVSSTVTVIEEFGSSYEKAKAGLSAIKLHFPNRRIIAVFEPHTFSWRNKAAIEWYDDVFEGVDKVLIYEPYSQGAATHEQLTQAEIVERVKKAGYDADAVSSKDETIKKLSSQLQPQDVVVLISSGGFDGIIEAVPQLVEKKFPLNSQ